MDNLIQVLSYITPTFVFYTFVGSLVGLLVGAVPGLSVTMATALLVSITFSWPVNLAIGTMLGLFVSGVYAGAVSAILINIPGAPSSVATTLDGFPMAQRGEAAFALWTATVHSFIGSVVGFVVLAFVAEPVTQIALKFSPMDYFLLALFGLSTVGSLTAKSFTKGCIAASFGLLLSLVGSDPVSGVNRFTFGTLNLQAGIGIIPVLIGLFGFSEVLDQIAAGNLKALASTIGKVKRDFIGQMKYLGLSIRAAIIGVIVGALPGAGGPIAALIAYDHAKKTVKNPERPFGTGTPEGVVASESANNACIGGALIPMLTLAIPGDAVTAVILAGFYVHGLRPGPMLFIDSPDLFRVVLAGGIVACAMMLLLGATIVPLMSRIVLVPKKVLLPMVSVICVIGTYAVNTSLFDVWLMFFFGLIGYLMKRRSYPVAPAVLGLVLGSMMDASLRRAINLALSSDHFMRALFLKQITLVLLVFVVFSLLMNIPAIKKKMTFMR